VKSSQTGFLEDADELDHHSEGGGAPQLCTAIHRIGSQAKLSEKTVRNALRRYEQRGLVERVSTKIYINHLNQQFSPRDLINILRPESYISLESAMVEKGITTQSPSVLTCVTPGYPQSFRTKSVAVVYRKISSDLYWGYEQRATRYNTYQIAEPEKALLDWVYLTRQEGLPTPLDELQLDIPQHRKTPQIRRALSSYGSICDKRLVT
jgi:predicted transcriptional regulator of viral defense system